MVTRIRLQMTGFASPADLWRGFTVRTQPEHPMSVT
jgi:hypothetical protein